MADQANVSGEVSVFELLADKVVHNESNEVSRSAGDALFDHYRALMKQDPDLAKQVQDQVSKDWKANTTLPELHLDEGVMVKHGASDHAKNTHVYMQG